MNRSWQFKVFTSAVAICVLASPLARAEVVLKQKIKDNSTTVVETHELSEQTLSLAGMEIKTKSDTTITTKSAAGQRAANGEIQVTSNVAAIQALISLPGGVEYQFDSTNPDQAAPIEQLEIIREGLRAVLGAAFVSTHDAKNEVLSITGSADMLSKLDAKTAQFFSRQYDEDYLKEKANTDLARVPGNPLSVGDTWELTDEMRIEGGQTLTFHNVFKYLGQVDVDGRKLDKIEINCKKVDYDMDADSPSPLKLKSSALKSKSTDSYLLFDRELGRPVRIRQETKITGDLTFTVNNTDVPAKLDLNMTTDSTLKP